MTLDTNHPVAVAPHLLRRDGTPLTPTCTVPLKMCCGEVLLGEECDCVPASVFSELPPTFLDLRRGEVPA